MSSIKTCLPEGTSVKRWWLGWEEYLMMFVAQTADKFEWNSYFSNRRFCFSKELLTQSSVYFSLCFLPIEYITQRHSVSIHYFCWWHSDIATYQLVFHLTLNIHSCLNESLWEVQHWMSNMVLWLISTNSCQ